MKAIGIVILNYNSWQDTILCAKTILKFVYEVKIVIVDNVSTDDSFLHITSFSIQNEERVIALKSDKNGGYSYGNNIGIKHLVYEESIEYIAVINPDVIIKDNVFESLAKKLEYNPSVGAIAPIMILNNYLDVKYMGIRIPRGIRFALSQFYILKNLNNYLKLKAINNIAYVDAIRGSFIFMNSRIWKKIDFFDESIFLYGEEIILGNKLRSEGLRCAIDIDTYFYHNHYSKPKKLSYMIKHYLIKLKSHLYFNKHYRGNKISLAENILLILLLPFKIVELFLLHLYKKTG